MLVLKYLLMILGAGLFGSAAALVAYDIFLSAQLRRLLGRNRSTMAGGSGTEAVGLVRRPLGPVRWRLALQLAALAVSVLRYDRDLGKSKFAQAALSEGSG